MENYPARMHRTTCDEASDSRDLISGITLADVGLNRTVEEGDPSALPAGYSTTTIDVYLYDLLADPHAITVHCPRRYMTDCLVCGAIGGTLSSGGNDVFIGLAETHGSGYAGTAWLHANPNGTTTVTVFLVQGLFARHEAPVPMGVPVVTSLPPVQLLQHVSSAVNENMSPGNRFVQVLLPTYRVVTGVSGLVLWAAWALFSLFLLREAFLDDDLGFFGALLAVLLGSGLMFVVVGMVADGLIQQSRMFDGRGLFDVIVEWWEARRSGPTDEEWSALPTLPNPGYHAYLTSDAWKQKREHMLRRAGYRCQVCNKKGRLELHHRTYERLGEEQIMDLIVLCAACHGLFHGRVN